MWRNGRRNGLKIRSREKRGMGSTPIIGTSVNVILLGKSSQFRIRLYSESSRKKTHENTVCVSTIRQLNLAKRAGDARALHAHLRDRHEVCLTSRYPLAWIHLATITSRTYFG